ncbi:MAG: hypothetical protein GY697_10435, partial [Desulfobacterales bacterium]|nr:hypothetical protein [Desulfobacterales bacterium]
TEMDKVTQQNAANAEESASASEEMNAQAEQMKAMVGNLVNIIGGSTGQSKGRKRTRKRKAAVAAHAPKALTTRRPAGDPEQIIPLEDTDFQDF